MKRLKLPNGTVWPDPTSLEELEWALRYATELTQTERFNAASVIQAYQQLCRLTARDVGRTVVALRRARQVRAAQQALAQEAIFQGRCR